MFLTERNNSRAMHIAEYKNVKAEQHKTLGQSLSLVALSGWKQLT